MKLLKQGKPKRQTNIIWLMIVLLIAAFAASLIVSGIMFSRSTRENREKIIEKAAKLAASQVDGDKVDRWLEEGTDGEYDRTAALLQDICDNTPYVQYIYVYKIEPDGCCVVSTSRRKTTNSAVFPKARTIRALSAKTSILTRNLKTISPRSSREEISTSKKAAAYTAGC